MKLIIAVVFALLNVTQISYASESAAKKTSNIITGKKAYLQINGFYEDDDLAVKIEQSNVFIMVYRYKEEGKTIIGSVKGKFDPKTGVAKGSYCERNSKYTGKAEIAFTKDGSDLAFIAYYTEGKKNSWKKDWSGDKSSEKIPEQMDLFTSKKGLCFISK
ncbi:MAG: hypothetical protein AB8G05_03740 [Oligoflexales bacterium]